MVRRLTPREQEVVALVRRGLSRKAVADRLRIAISTVDCHIGAAAAKVPCPLPNAAGMKRIIFSGGQTEGNGPVHLSTNNC
jgi:FixJ family two-component response regulator